MTEDERIEALEEFGYNAHEARFLALAALHSGYFVRRQYLEFLGKKYGYRDDALLAKAAARGHARPEPLAGRGGVYRLASHPFYAAIGEADNRNRRRRPPLAIKQKLMALDYVLAHRDRRYLATETEKIAYFAARSIPRQRLPSQRYRSDRTAESVQRFFVEKYPIAVEEPAESGSSSSVAAFCYVDEGVLSGSGFERFLERYGPLLSALGRSRLVYAAASARPFPGARRRFERFAGQLRQARWRLAGPDSAALAEYFELRHWLESKQYGRLDKAHLDRLRAYRQRFSQPAIEARYREFKSLGESEEDRKCFALEAEFEAFRLPHNYDLFG
jgi:hypothetical protein